MSHRKLIVARMDPADAKAVADIFAESDQTELPRMLGVTRRGLFRFHGVYLHLFESEQEIGPLLAQVRDHPLFADVNSRLARHISPYEPSTWRGPNDAMAEEFYTWRAK
nr:polyketide synthase [uncultured bacterium]